MASHRAIPVLSPPAPSHRPRLIASHRAPRHLGKALLAVGGLVASAALIGVSGPSPKAHASTTTLSGSIGGASISATQSAFGNWRGAPVTVVNNYMPHDTWADMANPTYGGPDYWKNSGVLVSWAVAMLPQSGGSIQTGATGAYNTYFASMAKKLIADGQGNSVIRLGWEMNGTWMSWGGTSDPASWIAYWKQIVTTMRAQSGAHFVFDWSPNADTAYNPNLLYPGDGYVDEVGMSVYDQSFAYTTAQYVQRWNELYYGLNGTYGLAWLASFSKTHNKPMAFGEWGLAQRCDGHGGNDDPYFISQMHTFFANNNVAWEAYFNIDPSDQTCQLDSMTAGHFPNAAALYKQLFSQPFQPVYLPTTTGTAATSSDVVLLSTNVDRSAPMKLAGASLHGPAYIWAQTSATNLKVVDFYLDGATSPTHAETSAPYDLVGGTNTAAVAFDPDSLALGTHTLKVVVVRSTGSTTYTSSFTAGSSTTSGAIVFSRSASRVSPAALNGTTQTTPVYIYEVPRSGTTQVAFYLDGATKPTHVEAYGPYDFVGGTDTVATAFNPRSLSAGSHSITAVLAGTYGLVTLKSTFTVA